MCAGTSSITVRGEAGSGRASLVLTRPGVDAISPAVSLLSVPRYAAMLRWPRAGPGQSGAPGYIRRESGRPDPGLRSISSHASSDGGQAETPTAHPRSRRRAGREENWPSVIPGRLADSVPRRAAAGRLVGAGHEPLRRKSGELRQIADRPPVESWANPASAATPPLIASVGK